MKVPLKLAEIRNLFAPSHLSEGGKMVKSYYKKGNDTIKEAKRIWIA